MANKVPSIRIPIYLQLIVTYLLILLLVFVILSPVLSRAIALSKHNYLIEAEHALRASATVLDNTFREIYQLPPKLEDNSYYVRLKIAPGNPLGAEAYTGMFMTGGIWAKQLATLEYVDEVFLFLSNNGVTFGKLRVFESLEDYLAFDLVYEDRDAAAVRDWIAGSRQASQVYPAGRARVHRGAPQEYLMVAMTRPNDSVTVGAVLSQRNLLDLFGVNNLPENCFLYLTSPAGELLYAYQYDGALLPPEAAEATLDGEAYSVLSVSTVLPALNIRLGIPESYFRSQQQPLIDMVRGIQWAAILLGIVLSALFALLNALPVRKLARGFKHSGPGAAPSHIRELDAIGGYLHTSSQTIETLSADIADMERTLRSNVLLQLLYGTLSSAEEALAIRLIPQTAAPYRVAVLTLTPDDPAQGSEYIGYYMHRRLEGLLPPDAFVLGQISPYKTAALFADTPENRQRLRQAHEALGEAEVDGAHLISCGVSEALAGKKNVGVAYRHAQFALTQAEGGLRYWDALEATAGAQPVGFYGMQRLYDYIMGCDRQQAENLLLRIRQSLRHEQQETMQVFYLVRFVFESVMQDGGLTQAQLVLPEYAQAMGDEELLDMLRGHSLALIDALEAKREHGKTRWQADMLAYIADHFAEGELYADAIAELFGVSRNLVYKVVREHTGKSLNEYIEHLRMQRAMDLLRSTQLTVAEVAERCGYNSTNTFYKVFKKNFGISPSNARG